jgi:hypothetical protein
LSSDVRHHRPFTPNRRPLLISALLVLLTSVPTMIVVMAGSATLDSAPVLRHPAVVSSAPSSSGLHPSGPLDRQSLGAVPTPPQPPARSSPGGSAGGAARSKAPHRTGPAKASVKASPPEASPPEIPIQDRAWPGWDGAMTGEGESAVVVSQTRYPSGSVDRAVPVGRFAVSGLPSGARAGVVGDDRPCRRERLAGPLGAPGRAAPGVPAGDGLVSLDAAAGIRDRVVVDQRH